MDNIHNFFEGENALIDFCNPDNNPPTPLVELPASLNPFKGMGIRIYAKMMNLVPLGNIKSLPAFNMLRERVNKNDLPAIHSLIESSSGNTALSLAIIGRLLGIHTTRAIVSHEVSPGKLKLLKFFGVDITIHKEPICPDPSDPTSGISLARIIGTQSGWFNPDQYSNEGNPGAHEQWTGPQLWKQTRGTVSVICGGLGTTGTLVGISRFIRNHSEKCTIVGVTRKPNNPVPGVRTHNLLREISFGWQQHINDVTEIGSTEAYEKSLDLCRNGLIVGPSSGFAYAGLLQYLKKQSIRSPSDLVRDKNGECHAIFLCPDSPLPYIDEYFSYCDKKYFPPISHEELLINSSYEKKEGDINQSDSSFDFELEPLSAHTALYGKSPSRLWNDVHTGRKIYPRSSWIIFDIRNEQEFTHFHMPGAINTSSDQLIKIFQEHKKQFLKKKLLIACSIGNRSNILASFLQKKGITAYSLKGGTLEWSRLNLPRMRPALCK